MINIEVLIISWSESYAQQIDSVQLHCTDEEKERGKKFKKETDRAAYLLWCSYIREACSKMIGISPALISISRDNYGRPFLTDYSNKIDFNISHSGSKLAIGISTDGKIGVDLEKIIPIDIREIQKFFTREEMSYIDHSRTNKTQRLFQVWTSIEAYSKLLGIGLDKQIKKRIFTLLNKDQALIQHAGSPIFVNSFKCNKYILSVASKNRNFKVNLNKIDLG
ncbi:MAG: 4'-phosphopantetheinyl transferase superfamily protein [Patescibacteria group bacterium]|jgi:phosphopantetheinyl transferase